jgi:putative transposase
MARNVWAGAPHHVTQRGNRGGPVFFSDGDRLAYLRWLCEYSALHGVEILAYCLMTNHVHLVAVPADEWSLQAMLKPLHMRHAQRVNRARGWRGHVWQGRFFSSILDEEYLWAAIRYVERNPVRAGIVRSAEGYAWSSAQAHCGLRSDPVLTADPEWQRTVEGVGDWAAWLAEADPPEKLAELRRNAPSGLPCGSDTFVRALEKKLGRSLVRGQPGRPRKSPPETG